MVDGVSAVAASVSQSGGTDMLRRSISPHSTQNSGVPFGSLLGDAVGQVDALEKQAHAAVTGLMTGNGVDVHQAMIAAQKADMAFELALSVRNKAVQAYQSVMGMQF
jgi:flagellar hook-basal body complex protein FliE